MGKNRQRLICYLSRNRPRKLARIRAYTINNVLKPVATP